MDLIEKSIYALFPTLIRFSSHDTTFKGTFEMGEDRGMTFVTFHVPNYPNADGITYDTEMLLSNEDVERLKLVSQSETFLDFLKLFENIITKQPPKTLLNKNSFELFYNDIMKLRKKYTSDVQFSFDCDSLILTIKSCSLNLIEHFLYVKICFSEKDFYWANVTDCNLPKIDNQNLFKKSYSIISIYEQFLKIITCMQIFYETMHNIDTICWVLDPIEPKSYHNYRRIVIDTDVSLEIIFDPMDMTKVPTFKFFGPSHLTEKHIFNLSENLEDWDPDYNILQNIMKLLDLPYFAMKPEEDDAKEEENLLYNNTECCVCFSYTLNDKTPEIICANSSCTVHFHSKCLYEWLSSLLTSQIMFKQIHGTCPNCEEAIHCEVPEK